MCNYSFSRADDLVTLKHSRWGYFLAKSFCGGCLLFFFSILFQPRKTSAFKFSIAAYFEYWLVLRISAWKWKRGRSEQSKNAVCLCSVYRVCFFNLGGTIMCCNNQVNENRNWKLNSVFLLWLLNWFWKSSAFWDEPRSPLSGDGCNASCRWEIQVNLLLRLEGKNVP